MVHDTTLIWPACLPARMTAFGFTFGFQGSKAHVSTSKEVGLEVLAMGVFVDCNGTINIRHAAAHQTSCRTAAHGKMIGSSLELGCRHRLTYDISSSAAVI